MPAGSGKASAHRRKDPIEGQRFEMSLSWVGAALVVFGTGARIYAGKPSAISL